MPPSNPYLYTMSSACLSGIVGVFLNLLTAAGITSMQSVALRAVIAFIGYGIFLLFTDRSAFRINPRDWYYFLGIGVLHFLLMNLCYFNTIKASSMSVAVVLMYLAPTIIVFASALLFKEALTPAKLISLVITLAGCALVTGLIPLSEQSIPMKAILFGVGAALGYSAYPILGKVVLQKYSSGTVSFYMFLFASLFTVPVSGLLQNLNLLLDWRAILGALGLGVLCTIVSYILYNKGLRWADPGKVSILSTIELFVATLLGVCLYGDKLTVYKIMGMLCICAAVVLLNRPMKKSASPSQ